MRGGSQHEFGFIGSQLALDFANTVDWRASDRPHDRLESYTHLVSWAHQAGILDVRQSAYMAEVQAARMEESSQALRTAKDLREAIYRLMTGAAAGRISPQADLEVLNRMLRECLLNLGIASSPPIFRLRWGDDDLLDRPLWPVAWAAVQLLVSPDLARVKACASADGCGRLFLDLSKNQSRRWCRMRSCGNTAKARRHRERRRRTAERL